MTLSNIKEYYFAHKRPIREGLILLAGLVLCFFTVIRDTCVQWTPQTSRNFYIIPFWNWLSFPVFLIYIGLFVYFSVSFTKAERPSRNKLIFIFLWAIAAFFLSAAHYVGHCFNGEGAFRRYFLNYFLVVYLMLIILPYLKPLIKSTNWRRLPIPRDNSIPSIVLIVVSYTFLLAAYIDHLVMYDDAWRSRAMEYGVASAVFILVIVGLVVAKLLIWEQWMWGITIWFFATTSDWTTFCSAVVTALFIDGLVGAPKELTPIIRFLEHMNMIASKEKEVPSLNPINAVAPSNATVAESAASKQVAIDVSVTDPPAPMKTVDTVDVEPPSEVLKTVTAPDVSVESSKNEAPSDVTVSAPPHDIEEKASRVSETTTSEDGTATSTSS